MPPSVTDTLYTSLPGPGLGFPGGQEPLDAFTQPGWSRISIPAAPGPPGPRAGGRGALPGAAPRAASTAETGAGDRDDAATWCHGTAAAPGPAPGVEGSAGIGRGGRRKHRDRTRGSGSTPGGRGTAPGQTAGTESLAGTPGAAPARRKPAGTGRSRDAAVPVPPPHWDRHREETSGLCPTGGAAERDGKNRSRSLSLS